jgi:hypothetical protein
MRRVIALLATTAAFAVAALVPSASSADPTGTCPDSFMPIPDQFAGSHVHDKNANGMVCRKFRVNQDGTVEMLGGPDDNDPLSLDWADDLG